MFEKLDNCPSCGHTQFQNHLIATDHLVSSESFALVKCEKCQLVFTNPRPDESNISKYYHSEQYYSHHQSLSPIGIAYSLAKHFTLRWKVNLISKYSYEPARLLDYGCGTGDFIKKAQDKAWQITGVEKDPDALHQAQNKTNTTIYRDHLSLEGSFEIITLWHVMEHIHDLKTTFGTITRRLTKDGHLLIALPNILSEDSEKYGEHWAGLDVPRHLYHFTKYSFNQFIKPYKLKLVEILPMKLDAYYVSLLSEKYKAKGNYLKAFNQARLSNKMAQESGEYSSLIYVLKR